MSNQHFGEIGEKAAADFLKREGYHIIDRNFRTKFGEIDIVAIDDYTVVYIEVKARSSQEFGLPEEAVDFQKLEHLKKAAAIYRSQKTDLPEGERIDVVAIETNTGRMELIKNVTG